jgi:predicted RNase H-like HicB family nuclease
LTIARNRNGHRTGHVPEIFGVGAVPEWEELHRNRKEGVGIIQILNKDFRNRQPMVIQENTMSTFTAVLHKEDDTYVAECPEVGTVSQGKTVEEAVSNLKEATELYLEEFPLTKKKRAILTTFEVSSVATS